MSGLKPGTKVLHPLFGAGTVRAMSGSGANTKITVDFCSGVGQKTLLECVANLKIADVDEKIGSAQKSEWFEVLEASASPKPGRHPPRESLHAALKAAVQQMEFWIAV